ncbi:Fungal specific transcription factor domain, partial [Geosmithia morbida]
RVEHVQRHERTHTKEKPFQCPWDRCGKTFGRRDLLVRHEKLVHLNENSRDNVRPRKIPSGSAGHPTGHHTSLSDSHMELDSTNSIHHQPLTQLQQPPPPAPPPLHPAHQHPHQHQHHQSLPTHFHPTSPLANPLPHDQQQQQQPRPPSSSRPGAGNLDLLSDAALAREVNGTIHPMAAGDASQQPPSTRPKPYSHHEEQADGAVREGYAAPGVVQDGFQEDYNLLLDDFGPAPHFLPPHFDPDQQSATGWARPDTAAAAAASRRPSYGNAFPSLGQDADDAGARAGKSLRISITDHNTIKNRLDEFSPVLPRDFVFPSRHTLTRFLEGYTSGFHEHVPFLHLPTFSPVDAAPELLLAMLAVGAQYRFESNRGYALWYAAKAVATEQIRRRHSSDLKALLPTPAAYSPHSTRPSPSATYRHSRSVPPSRIRTESHTRLETIQAVLLLFAIGLWGAEAIVHEAMALQGNLAVLIRQEGLTVETAQASVTDWEAWVRLESATRTKLAAYCFFNLCSTAYNLPPLLLTSEMGLYLPVRSRLWRAETAWQWQEQRAATPVASMTVHDAFARLFGGSGQGLPAQLSSLANYVLIHAVLQHIYLLKQTSLAAGSPYVVHRMLRPEDVEDVSEALRVWQASFEHMHEMRAGGAGGAGAAGGEPAEGSNPLAYNASALLRLAYIRLYTDVPPARALETHDSMLIASALSATPILTRSLRLHRAVFQAVHALSMLVKAGVSMQLRMRRPPGEMAPDTIRHRTLRSPEEKSLLGTVRRMLDETEFAVHVDPSLSGMMDGAGGGPSSRSGSGSSASGTGHPMDMAATAGSTISTGSTATATTTASTMASDSAKLRQLAAAVVRLWAETFNGSHMFDVVKVMGTSLDGYADLIERSSERTPPGRMMSDGGM